MEPVDRRVVQPDNFEEISKKVKILAITVLAIAAITVFATLLLNAPTLISIGIALVSILSINTIIHAYDKICLTLKDSQQQDKPLLILNKKTKIDEPLPVDLVSKPDSPPAPQHNPTPSPPVPTLVLPESPRTDSPSLISRTSQIIQAPIPLHRSMSTGKLIDETTTTPEIQPARPASANSASHAEKLASFLPRLNNFLNRDDLTIDIITTFFNDLNASIPRNVDLAEFASKTKIAETYDKFCRQFKGHEDLKSQAEGLKNFYEKMSATYVSEDLSSVSVYLKNLNEYDNPQANRIKASKYEAILNNLLAKDKKWLELLQTCTPKPKDQEIITCLTDLWSLKGVINENDASLDYLNKIREAYTQKALPILRRTAEVALSAKYSSPYTGFIFELCADLYTETSLKKENEALIQAIAPNRPKEGSLIDELNGVMQAYSDAPQSLKTNIFNRLFRSLNDFFDNKFSPLNAGNPAQKMFHYTTGKSETTIVAMGCPTIQEAYQFMRGSPKAVVDPIFLAYLHANRGVHLYFSNQDHRKAEKERGDKIIEIQTLKNEDGTLKHPHFYAVAICKNSDFYKNGGSSKASDFKQELIARFLDQDSLAKHGCYIPPRIYSKEELEPILMNLSNRLHHVFFKNQDELTLKDRRLFIDTFDALLEMKICVKLNPKFLNFICRDDVDRGAESLAEFINILLLSMYEILDAPREHREMLVEALFTRAFWARKRAILVERYDRFKENAIHLNEILNDKEIFIAFQELVKEIIRVVEIKKV